MQSCIIFVCFLFFFLNHLLFLKSYIPTFQTLLVRPLTLSCFASSSADALLCHGDICHNAWTARTLCGLCLQWNSEVSILTKLCCEDNDNKNDKSGGWNHSYLLRTYCASIAWLNALFILAHWLSHYI